MTTRRILTALTAFLLGLGGAVAQEPKERPHAQKSQETQVELEREAEEMLAAVVRVRMKAIPNARSNTTLGPSREGTGVVIDERGHIVTIGYIVIEADSIEITTRDERTVPATLIGYDHASGFGLLRSGAPLGVKPMPMGLAADLAMREAVMVLPAGGRDAASLAYVVSRRKFAASWEYLLETAIFTAPPTLQWAGAALVSREGKLVGIGSLYVRETQESGSELQGKAGLLDFLHGMLAAVEHEPGLVVVGDGGFLTEGSIGSVQRPARSRPVPGARLRAAHLAHVGGERVSAQANFDFRLGAMRIVEAKLPLYILDACLTVVQISHSRLNRDHRSGSSACFRARRKPPTKKSA